MPKTDAFPTFDPAAVFPQFELPNIDAVTAAQRRNLEAVTAASKVAADGFKALTTRQFEFARGAVDAYVAAVRDVMSAGDPQAGSARQAEYAKAAFETSVAGTRELTEIAVKANAEAFDVLNRRVADGLDEIHGLTRRDAAKPAQTRKDAGKNA